MNLIEPQSMYIDVPFWMFDITRWRSKIENKTWNGFSYLQPFRQDIFDTFIKTVKCVEDTFICSYFGIIAVYVRCSVFFQYSNFRYDRWASNGPLNIAWPPWRMTTKPNRRSNFEQAILYYITYIFISPLLGPMQWDIMDWLCIRLLNILRYFLRSRLWSVRIGEHKIMKLIFHVIVFISLTTQQFALHRHSF